jgi:hypothetical protein
MIEKVLAEVPQKFNYLRMKIKFERYLQHGRHC